MLIRLFPALLTLTLTAIAETQTCRSESEIPSTAPTSRYQDNSDGTVTDTQTGLMWARCSLGQDALTCSGSTADYTWLQALHQAGNSTLAGYSDWRLPSVRELLSLVEDRCYSPAINAAVFPGTVWSDYWSSSAAADDSSHAWNVYFGNGGTISYRSRSSGRYVRLVRTGQ